MDDSDKERMRNIFERHTGKSEISIEQHIKNTRLSLAESLKNRAAIYLDTRYWVILCESSLGRTKSEKNYELLRIISDLVGSGEIFCPISESTFVEVMKQGDMKTRHSTAMVIDKLSLGVALIPFFERVECELDHLLYSSMSPDLIYPLNSFVWSKLSCVLGVTYPSNTKFEPDHELLIQKSFFDFNWDISLVEMTNLFFDEILPKDNNFETLASRLNNNNVVHTGELRSYEHTYLNEISGALDIFGVYVTDTLRTIASNRGYARNADIGSSEMLLNYLREAFRKGKINKLAPSLDVYAHCHASVRWNKGRKLETNDFFDFHHASAALGFCQAFFTERSLCSLLTEKKISLDKKHDCFVCYKVDDAIEYLNTLSS